MSFLGGLLSGIVHTGPLAPIGTALDAVKGLASLKKKSPTVAKILDTQLLPSKGMGAPVGGGGVIKGSGRSAPALPGISGTFSDVRVGSSSTAPGRYRIGRKRRRMNPMNVKAVRRAARRLESAEKLFKRIFTMRHHKSAGSVTAKSRRKR